jgi:hypothetical protein
MRDPVEEPNSFSGTMPAPRPLRFLADRFQAAELIASMPHYSSLCPVNIITLVLAERSLIFNAA